MGSGKAHRSGIWICLPHVRPPRNGDRKGEVREHCLSPRRGRVAQRPFRSSTAGKPEGPAHLGRLFFGYFLLAKQKKVTCCRAAPGEVELEVSHSFSNGSPRTKIYPRNIFNL